MRKFVFWIGVGALTVCLLLAAGIAYVVHVSGSVDKEASSYARDAVTDITAHWDASKLKARAAASLLKTVPDDKFSSLFEWFSSLGSLVENKGCTQFNVMVSSGAGTVATYDCSAEYEHGPARLRLMLVKQAGTWRINGFNVTSDALIARTQQQKL